MRAHLIFLGFLAIYVGIGFFVIALARDVSWYMRDYDGIEREIDIILMMIGSILPAILTGFGFHLIHDTMKK